jgi:hypothetical protein
MAKGRRIIAFTSNKKEGYRGIIYPSCSCQYMLERHVMIMVELTYCFWDLNKTFLIRNVVKRECTINSRHWRPVYNIGPTYAFFVIKVQFMIAELYKANNVSVPID